MSQVQAALREGRPLVVDAAAVRAGVVAGDLIIGERLDEGVKYLNISSL